MPQIKVNSIEYNDSIGQKEATTTITNNAILFLRDMVDAYNQSMLGDPDDPKFQALKLEVQQDLHEAWKTMNPS